MAEMMRQQDRLIQSLDVVPGGYQALSRLYDIQRPLESALMDFQGDRPSSQTPQEFRPPQQHENVSPLPNPWASPRTTPPSSSPPLINPFNNIPLNNPLQAVLGTPPPQGFPSQGLGVNGSDGLLELMNNPAIQQMMLSNPQALQQMTQEMLSNPQALQQLQQFMPFGTPQSFPSFGAPLPTTPNVPASTPNGVNLEVQYSTQLTTLRDMGFTDTVQCIRELQASGGNVYVAVERLLALR